MTEYEKMQAGEWIVTNDPEIVRRNRAATRLWREFSQTGTDDEGAWRKAMAALLPHAHPTAVVKPPFRCDFGTEIYLGEKAFVNFNCTILDGAKVTIGARALIGPDCGIYTPEHPIDWQERNSGIERLKPVTIGEDCWIGGHVTILPGVTIGARSIVAAGSVVVKDVPEGVMVAGNPARVVKSLEVRGKK